MVAVIDDNIGTQLIIIRTCSAAGEANAQFLVGINVEIEMHAGEYKRSGIFSGYRPSDRTNRRDRGAAVLHTFNTRTTHG